MAELPFLWQSGGRFASCLFVRAGWLLIGACAPGSSLADVEPFCNAGDVVFCRCPGGEPGSKECGSDGLQFGDCMVGQSRCSERPTESAGGSPVTTSVGGFEPGGAGGSGGSVTGTGEFLSSCAQHSDCESGRCPMGFCTIDCASVNDCPADLSECVNFASEQICMPTCGTLQEPQPEVCDGWGPPIECGFTPAIDDWKVVTCAPWGPFLQLSPQGTDCDFATQGDLQCNLGHEGMEAVCTGSGVCAKGCFEDKNCPDGTNCSSSGSQLGSCN